MPRFIEQAGRGYVRDHQRDHHSRWMGYVKPPIYFGSFGALGGFAFWVALIWFGTCGKAAAPSIESDLFNPSIPRVRRTKDGGFDAVVPRGPIFADSRASKDILLHTSNGKGRIKMSSTKFESDPEQDTHTAAFAERVRANQKKAHS
jgi:hypothetical protein